MMHRQRRPARLTLLALGALLLSPGLALAQQQGGGKVTKYARFRTGQSQRASYGIVEGDRIRRLSGPFGAWEKTQDTFPLSEVTLLVPTRPSKVLAAAGNYRSHLGTSPPFKNPEYFYKPPSCLVPNGVKIELPRDSARVDPEGELVIVIGKRAHNVSVGEALSYVLGVTCGNDVSARDWQKGDRQWWRAKGANTFGPCGPFIVSGLDYGNLLLQTRVNGEVKQKENTKEFVHSVPEMVSWASRHVTLEPGDLIYTGTPGHTDPLKPGDIVEVEIGGVGVLRNPVVAAPSP